MVGEALGHNCRPELSNFPRAFAPGKLDLRHVLFGTLSLANLPGTNNVWSATRGGLSHVAAAGTCLGRQSIYRSTRLQGLASQTLSTLRRYEVGCNFLLRSHPSGCVCLLWLMRGGKEMQNDGDDY